MKALLLVTDIKLNRIGRVAAYVRYTFLNGRDKVLFHELMELNSMKVF